MLRPFLGFFVASLFASALLPNQVYAGSVGLSGGGNNPYGILGLEGDIDYGRLDLNGGFGISDAGLVGGVGGRFYFMEGKCMLLKYCRDREFIGLHLVRATGTNEVELKEGEESSRYRIPPVTFVNLNVGTKSIFSERFAFIVRLGYQFALQKKEAEFLSGTRSKASDAHAKEAVSSGFSISAGAMVQI